MKAPVNDTAVLMIEEPISIGVTSVVGTRSNVAYPSGHPDAAVTVPFALIPALLDHIQRVACEGARGAATSHPNSQAFMEGETGRKGWRAFVQQDSAHLIHVLEESGLADFTEIDGA